MLQERIETLGSGILTFKGNSIFILGFNNVDRLNDYYLNGNYCHCSQGIYNNGCLNFGRVKDNALFILIKDNIEFKRYYFEVIFKDTIKYKNDSLNKWASKACKIRKCKYNNIYNLILREKKITNGGEETFTEFYDFNSLDLLKDFFFKRFSKELPFIFI